VVCYEVGVWMSSYKCTRNGVCDNEPPLVLCPYRIVVCPACQWYIIGNLEVGTLFMTSQKEEDAIMGKGWRGMKQHQSEPTNTVSSPHGKSGPRICAAPIAYGSALMHFQVRKF